MRHRVTLALALIVLSGGAAASTTPAAAAFAAALFESLQAERFECPPESCATVPLELKPFRAALDEFLREHPEYDAPRMLKTRWVTEDGVLTRRLLGTQSFILRFEPQTRTLVVSPLSCFAKESVGWNLAHAGLGTHAGDEVFVFPKKVASPHPEYPEKARRSRASGAAAVQAVIGANGAVADACVLLERPEGMGFGKAAVEAVKKWRYESATRDGQPVSVLVGINLTFELSVTPKPR